MTLLCGACAAQVVPVTSHIQDISLYRQPAGYYAGIGDGFLTPPELTAWLAKNQTGIEDIQRRIAELRDGRRTPGCIGEDKYTCVATLSQKLAVADDYSAKDENIFADTRYDVNGKPVTGSKVSFIGYVPNAASDVKGIPLHYHTTFNLTLNRDGAVSSLEARLPKDPTFARTQEEYDATAVYETVSGVTAKTCPALGRAEVAKWVENTVKPNSKAFSGHVNRGTAKLEISKKTAFCGRTFQFNSVWASRSYNQHRRDVVGGMIVVVE